MTAFKIAPLLCALSFASTLPCHADLVAHYGLDETDATAAPAADSLGANPGAVIGGSANLTKGFASPKPYLGGSYDFGLRGGLDLGAGNAVRPVDQWTMTWWMRPTTLNSFDRIYETLSGTGNDGNGIRIDLGGSPGDSLRVLLRDGNGSTNTQHTHSLNFTLGEWYFCVVRYDSDAGDGSALKITVLAAGGADITAGEIAAATQSPGPLGTGPLFIHGAGAYLAADDADAAGANDFGGSLDDFAIFQTGDAFGVLTDAQLAEVHNSGALGFDPPAPLPTVGSFTASPTSIASGGSATLEWEVAAADSVEITPGVGAVAAMGSAQVSPVVTQVYTLTAGNAEGSVTATVQVTVDGALIPPRISEFVASNTESFLDGDGNSSDWIELHNRNATPFDLSGYFLTDARLSLDKWPFPQDTVVPAGGYLIVFASGQATASYVDGGGYPHTNFSLDNRGEYLALVSPDGATVLQEFDPYPPQREDISFGDSGYFSTPTPGAANSTSVGGFVEDTQFSVDRGFFDAPFQVEITSATPGAQIFYTRDGSVPSPTNGALYTAPLSIAATTVLRATAFRDGLAPTNTDTQTYLFLSDVVQQPNDPPGHPTSWAGRPADYEMDTEVVDDPDFAEAMIPALLAFPSLSVAIDHEDFYGGQGIYQNPQSQGDAWERPASAELFVGDGAEPGFQIDAGLRIQGGSSRNPDTPKHSFSLRFRKEYGEGKLRYPMFEEAPGGESAVGAFDFLQLRSGYNFGWVHRHYYQSRHAQYNRDQFANDLHLAMGNTGIHGRWVHLYINGIYWGIYHVHERPDADYMASYFGDTPDSYDAINSGRAVNGTTSAYNSMASRAANNIADPANYAALHELLDIPSFIDYMLMNFYVGNRDWDGHNWRAAGGGSVGEPFRFFPWDTEFAISPNGAGVIQNPAPLSAALTANVTGKNGNNRPTGIHQDLTQNEEYRLQFADHAHRHLFNGGALSPEGATAIWKRRSAAMDLAIVAESARWGDFRRDVQAGSQWNSSQYDLYTKDHYLADQAWIIDTYLQQRSAAFLGQLRARGLYPGTDAPEFDPHGGEVPTGFALTMGNPNAAGTLYYTLDGSDPRIGASVPEDILLLDEGAPARALVQSSDGGLDTTWTEIGFDAASWKSGSTGVGFENTAGEYDPITNLYVREMSGNNASCLIRVPFTIADLETLDSIATLSLNMKYDDGYAAFINGIYAGGKNDPASLVWNARATTSHPDQQALQFEPLDISGAVPQLVVGENVLAIQGLNAGSGSSDFLIVPQITYQTAAATGVSPSAEVYTEPVTLPGSGIVNARVLLNGTWSALNSAQFIVGTPAVAGKLVVSEIHYNPAGADESGEFIELMNVSAQLLQLGAIAFTEGIGYRFPLGAELAPGMRLVLTPQDYTGNLDNSGETVALLDAAGTAIESFRYNDRAPWPEAPDGDGPSLVRVAPASLLDPSLPGSWRSSTADGGNPGTSDAQPYPGGDVAQHAFGPAPEVSAAILDGVLQVTHSRNLAADDVVYSAEVSADLLEWVDAGDGFIISDDRLTATASAVNRTFVRFSARLREP